MFRSILPFIILALSDTSMTKLSDDEFSLDGEDNDDSIALATAARSSLNLPARKDTRNITTSNSKSKKGSSRSKQGGENSVPSRQPVSLAPVLSKSVNFLNSDKWSKDVRPPHLEDDEVFNTLSVEAAAQHIMQWMTTKTMMASNEIKEKRSRSTGGRERPDEKI